MIQSILNGMAEEIVMEFGDGYEIYTEKIEQGLAKPCFYLSCADTRQNRFRGEVHLVEHRFMVLYFPKSEEVNAECMATADRLWSVLEFIDTKHGRFMGKQMQADVRDGVLNFNLTYGGHFRKSEKPAEYMENLQYMQKGVE